MAEIPEIPESAVERMCFSAGNPHARSHNEWVIACGKLEDALMVADHGRKMYRFAFWALWVCGAVLYYGEKLIP